MWFIHIYCVFLFSACLLNFLSRHLHLSVCSSVKTLTKCAKKFSRKNPNNPFLIKYTSSN